MYPSGIPRIMNSIKQLVKRQVFILEILRYLSL